MLPALGSFSRRAVFPDLGPWICDTGHIFDTFWTLNRDAGCWNCQQLHTSDIFSDPGLGPWALDSTTVTHFRHILGIESDRIASDLRYRPHFSHNLDPQFGPWAGSLDLATVIYFSHIGLWICHIYTSFCTFGSDRIGSDRIGSNSKESCVDPIVKNPHVWIQ